MTDDEIDDDLGNEDEPEGEEEADEEGDDSPDREGRQRAAAFDTALQAYRAQFT